MVNVTYKPYMLSVFMLNVVMLSVVAPFIVQDARVNLIKHFSLMLIAISLLLMQIDNW
jgi:hypothetical protein